MRTIKLERLIFFKMKKTSVFFGVFFREILTELNRCQQIIFFFFKEILLKLLVFILIFIGLMILRYHNAINENIEDFERSFFVSSCNKIIFKLERSNKKQTKIELSKQKKCDFFGIR